MTPIPDILYLSRIKNLLARVAVSREGHFFAANPRCFTAASKCPLSLAQQRLFITLKPLLMDCCTIFYNMPVKQFIAINEKAKILDKKTTSLLRADFLIVDSNFLPVITIDVRTKDRLSSATKQVLRYKEQLLLTAGIPLLVIEPAESYCMEGLCAMLPKQILRSSKVSPVKPWARFPYHARFNPKRDGSKLKY